MRAQISRWGNSLAVRIPGHLAREISISDGKSVELSVESGRIIVEPICTETAYDLDELIAGITDENSYEEVPTGEAVGKEFA